MGFLSRLFGRRKTEGPRRPVDQRAAPPRAPVQPDFPLGDNIVSDPDIRTLDDLRRHYPLPTGFEYREMEDGVPAIVRAADGARFRFLIEAGLLTFDEAYTKEDGKTAYHTTEVFKKP